MLVWARNNLFGRGRVLSFFPGSSKTALCILECSELASMLHALDAGFNLCAQLMRLNVKLAGLLSKSLV